MENKTIEAFVIMYNDWYFQRLDSDSKPLLTSDFLSAAFFYDKQFCTDFAKETAKKMRNPKIEIYHISLDRQVKEKITI